MVALCHLIIRRPNIASLSADENTGLVLVSRHAWKWVPTAISFGGAFPMSLGVICYNR